MSDHFFVLGAGLFMLGAVAVYRGVMESSIAVGLLGVGMMLTPLLYIRFRP